MVKIVSREEWRAVEPKFRTFIPTPVDRLWLHHAASGGDLGATTVREIQRFHMAPRPRGRGWTDIGYSWLYSPALRTFYEGRGPGVTGAHTQGDNAQSHALCVLGHFDHSTPPAHVVDDLRAFLAWHGRYGPTQFTGGHRDAPGASTSCPGKHLHRLLPQINEPKDDDMPLTNEDVDRIADAVARKLGFYDPNRRGFRDYNADAKAIREGVRENGAVVGAKTKYKPTGVNPA